MIEKYCLKEKHTLLKIEKDALLNIHRLSLYRNVFLQKPNYFQLDFQKRSVENNDRFLQSTHVHILGGKRLW